MSLRLALGINVLWIPLAFVFDGVTVLVLPLKLGLGPNPASTVGLVSFAGLGAALLVQPLAGLLSDRLRGRVERRWFVAILAGPVLAGLWLLSGAVSVLFVAVGYLVLQMAASALQAVQQTFIPEHVPARARGWAGGLKTAFDLGGAFIAFLVLGWLLAGGDTVEAAGGVSILLLASLALVIAFVPAATTPPPSEADGGPLRTGAPTGFGRIVAARFLFLLGTYVVGRFLLLLIAERMGIDPSRAADETGGFLAIFTLITAVSALAFGRHADRLGRLPLMRLGAFLAAVGIAAFVPPAGLPGVLVAGTVLSLGTAAFVSANWAATTDLVPASDAGRLMGIANLGTGGAAACAGLLGPLIDWGGFTPALILAAISTLLAVAALAAPRSAYPARTTA